MYRMRIFLRGKKIQIFFGVLDIPDIFWRQTVDEEKVRVPPPHTHTYTHTHTHTHTHTLTLGHSL